MVGHAILPHQQQRSWLMPPALAPHLNVAWWQATLRMLRTSRCTCTASSTLMCCGFMNQLQGGQQGQEQQGRC
jgi:hypothetical protein